MIVWSFATPVFDLQARLFASTLQPVSFRIRLMSIQVEVSF